jgi:hypothetical protein
MYKTKEGIGKAWVEERTEYFWVRSALESTSRLFHLLKKRPPRFPVPPAHQEKVFPRLLRPACVAEAFWRVERKKGFRCVQVREVESKSREEGRVASREGVDVACEGS